jgi:rhodanese-related sulfurtransferase
MAHPANSAHVAFMPIFESLPRLSLVLAMLGCSHASANPTRQPAAATSNVPRVKSPEELIHEAQTSVDYIDAAELERRVAQNPKLILLDVRTQREYDAGHLKGAAWLERGVAEFVMVRKMPNPDAEIVVYCKAGNRTGLVVKSLRGAGYRNVVGLDGGFDAWATQARVVYNHLGAFKLVRLAERNASAINIDFFADKKPDTAD